MSGIVYVNGAYVPRQHAMVAMNDRGYHFADGIYEAIAFRQGVLLDGELHLDRLERSLADMKIPMPMTRRALKAIMRQLFRLNHKQQGVLYMQITRGVCTRNHLYPQGLKPVLTMMISNAKFRSAAERDNGIQVITVPDERWARCDIKSISLLPNMLARNAAAAKGCKEAWQIRDGVITEGSLSNAYIVMKDGTVRTHPKNERILGGVRRHMTLQLASEYQIKVVEEAFTMQEVAEAKEAFISSCSNYITPVVSVDGKKIGDGKVGPITTRLMDAFDEHLDAMIQKGWVA